MTKLIMLLVLLVGTAAHADSKMGLMGSLLFNTVEIDGQNPSKLEENSEIGFGIGMRALLTLNDRLYLRTGAGIVKKAFGLETSTGPQGDIDVSIIYLNIPATLYLKASPQVGIFAGTAINAKLSDDVEGGGSLANATDDANDTESMVFPAILGFEFMFNEQISLELSYEYGIMESAKDLKVSSLVTSLVYNFE
ncbi:MAG TPA: outer membrane beta-barrel protein [Bacteriovoracaceae bacterium]|nr:outer membrane beta-barrel protein [Bacteriovoracaceae bacterium]